MAGDKSSIDEVKNRRRSQKGHITKCINAISQHIAEEDLGKVKAQASKLKEVFSKFEEIHESIAEKVNTDDGLEECEKYFYAG